jgi:hypothetical protein
MVIAAQVGAPAQMVAMEMTDKPYMAQAETEPELLQ